VIRFDEARKLIHISSNNMSYLFFITGEGSVRNLYWGEPIDPDDAFRLGGTTFHSSFDHDIQAEREEYPLWNGHSFILPCLKAQGEAGRAIFPVYDGYELEEKNGVSRLDILLSDQRMGISVRLQYRLYEDCGILARSAVISAQKIVRLDTVMSASISLPFGQESRARWLTGKWAGEFKITEEDVKTGMLTLQSRQGVTGHHFNPAIALGDPSATETAGRVWFAALGYSGNWAIHVEKSIFGNTHIVAGINDFDFEMNLAPGDVFETPPLYMGMAVSGYGDMSRRIHRFVRTHILPSSGLKPVLYNSWEATAFHVQAEQQMRLADKAARIGCELFVVDDGWFGMRNSDAAGLGDWWVNQQKFPQGLDQLIDHVKSRGMKFGIWVEPESVNPDSELYRSHPDWIYRYPDVQPLALRNQYLLNLSLAPVREYLWDMLYDLLSRHDISFLKWDMNRAVTDMQSLNDGKGKELWYGHVKAVYGLMDELRKAFPGVSVEACSGGGGRVDLGILRYADQAWPSDNTDPYTRLFIQEGFSQFYPPAAMMCWVTDSPGGKEWSKRPLAYRFHSAMCGSLGIGADISKFSEEELEECACLIKQYKAWRHIIQNGELYRLIPPGGGPASAVQYVTTDRSETLVFLFINHPATDAVSRIIRLQGLCHDVRYITDTGETYAGSTLMNAGLCCPLGGDFASRVVYLKRLED
jgi:alpha-galactosidase